MSHRSRGRVGRKERRSLALIAAGSVPVRGNMLMHPVRKMLAPRHITGVVHR